MRFAFDSSSVINLFNVGALPLAARIPGCQVCLPPLVVGECEPSCASEIIRLRETNDIALLSDNDVDAELYLNLLDEHRLGAGETECIAVALAGGLGLCCDDRKARVVAKGLLGAGNVIGTLRVLRWFVEARLTTCEEAFRLSREIRARGGFVPEQEHDFFCADA